MSDQPLRNRVLVVRLEKAGFEDLASAKRWIRDHEFTAANMTESAGWYVARQRPGTPVRTVRVQDTPLVVADVEGTRVGAGSRSAIDDSPAANAERRNRMRTSLSELERTVRESPILAEAEKESLRDSIAALRKSVDADDPTIGELDWKEPQSIFE